MKQGTVAGKRCSIDSLGSDDTELDVHIMVVEHHSMTPNVAGVDRALRMARNRAGECLSLGNKDGFNTWCEIANDIYVSAFGPIGML